MVRKMNDDEIMDFVHNKVFGDLDGMEANELFKPTLDAVDNAKPESQSAGGMKITIEPLMSAAQEGGKPSDESAEDEEDDDEDMRRYKKNSPVMNRMYADE